MADLYLYGDVPVLKNKLDIRDGTTLDTVEAGMSRANMMLFYESGFHDFSPEGLCAIHRALFEDIYEWAGHYRIINIEKRERLLSGRSVWYRNDEDIPTDLRAAFDTLTGSPGNSSLKRNLFARWPSFSAHLAGPSLSGGKYPCGRDDDVPFCGAPRLLYGPRTAGRQRRICSGLICYGVAGPGFGA